MPFSCLICPHYKTGREKIKPTKDKFCFFICFSFNSGIIRGMKRQTIRNHRDFLTSPNDPKVVSDCFMLKAKSAKITGDARYGLIASKKTFKFAVQRNRAKRLMRDWLAFNEDLMLPDLDYIFILHNSILEYDRESGRKSVASALKKISKMHEKNAKESQ